MTFLALAVAALFIAGCVAIVRTPASLMDLGNSDDSVSDRKFITATYRDFS